MKWVVLLASLCCQLVRGQETSRLIPVQIGAGCELSDYNALQVVSGNVKSEPSYRFIHDTGMESGVLTIHFANFALPPDDFVLLRSKHATTLGTKAQILAGRNTSGTFYSFPIQGDGFIVELFKTAASSVSTTEKCTGFEIDHVRFTPQADMEALAEPLPTPKPAHLVDLSIGNSKAEDADGDGESLCGEDESTEAVCAATQAGASGAAMLQHSMGVARLVIRKDNGLNVAYCTGFLVGCEGHVLTNHHCIRHWLDALNTYVEFHAQAAQCTPVESCQERAACPGNLSFRTTTFIATSRELDYTLVKLDGPGLDQVGGYLQLRSSGPRIGDQVYIPQYPLGHGKRIAWLNNGQQGRIESLTANECGGEDAGYYVDTQEGSSGAPVISMEDHTVVALHHCGGCLNGGIPSQKLIQDFTLRGILPRCAVQ